MTNIGAKTDEQEDPTKRDLRAWHERTARSVAALLVKAGYENKTSHAPWLSQTLGISYSAAKRKLNGESSWLDADLYAVAEALKCPASAIFEEAVPRITAFVEVAGRYVEANVSIKTGEHTCSCDAYVAVERPAGIFVLRSDAAAGGRLLGLVEHIEIKSESGVRVALLDDETDVTETCRAIIEGPDLTVTVYRTAADLEQDPRKFDAYILDWWLGENKTSGALIRSLRERHGMEPRIYVISGEVETGLADESEIGRAVEDCLIVFHQKPVRYSLLKSDIMAHKKRTISAAPA